MIPRILATIASTTLILLVTSACQGQGNPEGNAIVIPIPNAQSASDSITQTIPDHEAAPTTNPSDQAISSQTETQVSKANAKTPTPTEMPTLRPTAIPRHTATQRNASATDTNYLMEEISPCTPIEGSTIDPCEPDAKRTPGIGGGIASSSGPVDSPATVRQYLDGDAISFIPHIVLRGTYIPDTVRCIPDNPFHIPSYVEPGYFQNSILMQCYADVRVNAYVLGSGPSKLTVLVQFLHYWQNYFATADSTHEEQLDLALWATELVLEEGDARISEDPSPGIFGREVLLFLGPPHNHAVEVWQVFGTWDVQTKADDTVIAVHPARDYWSLVRPDDYQTHQAALEMELPAFTQAVADAQAARITENNGRIADANISSRKEGVDLPMLITDANELSQFYRDTGAYGHPDGPPTQPAPVPSCANSNAVENTAANRPLRRDCTALLDTKDILAGTAVLNWSKDLAIGSWTGPTVSSTPERITAVNIASSSLNGTIPEGLAKLDALTNLDLSSNFLTGEIPGSLEDLEALTTLKLSGNSLKGCIPPALRDVATHDLDDLELPDCQPPTEAASCAGSTAVGTNPEQGLVDDCNTLLDSKDALAGTATLNWSKDLAMSDWTGVTLSGDRVHRVVLTDQDLDGSISALLGNLTALTRIDLDDNDLTGEIPAQLGNLKSLTHLYLFENQLSGEIPTELGQMTALQVLYLEDNDLTGSVPPELGNLANLTQLILGDNELSGTVPQTIGDIPGLAHLILKDNGFIGQIPRNLSSLTFTNLALSGNSFTGCLPTGMDTSIAHDLWRPELSALPSCGPDFSQNSYAFSVARASAAGTAVGTPTASPWDTGGTVDYAIISGNENGLFEMAQASGDITLARIPVGTDDNTYTLNIQGTDGHGQQATVEAVISLAE